MTDTESAYSVSTTNIPTKWTYTLPSKTCPNGGTDCHNSSPVIVDMNGDNKPDIVVATNNGHVVVIKNNGTLIWDKDVAQVAPQFGMAPGTQEISSSPAVADIDDDGYPEIAIGVGTTYNGVCTHGGIIVFEHDGTVKSGWPKLTQDENGDSCRDSIFSSPALGDLTGDGKLEIVVGGFDKRIYALQHNGALLPGFPTDSFLLQRFPDWDNLEGQLGDTIWSSPSLADMDGDGHLDIIIGTDEGNFDGRWGGDAQGWTCPYASPPGWAPGYCGGSLYVLDRFGNLLPGFPKHILEIIQSSPAVADVNKDGYPEIFVGTGSFYYNNSPDHPEYGFRLFGWDKDGNDLPGWEGGKVVDGVVSASPSIGNIDADSELEIVVGTKNRTLYAWNLDGSQVFKTTPKDIFGNVYPYGKGFILGDYDGDSDMEIILNMASVVAVVDGDGKQLVSGVGQDVYRAYGSLENTPTVGDIDGDGKLELIAHNTTLSVWDLGNSTDRTDWPMFRYNAARTGHPVQPMILVTPSNAFALHEITNTDDIVFTIRLKGIGGETINWSATNSNPYVTVSPTSGTFVNETSFTITVDSSSLSPGENALGNVTITGTANSLNMVNSPTSIPITVHAVDRIISLYLPMVGRD